MDAMSIPMQDTLYQKAVKLYDRRHRKLTVSRMHRETGLPIWFLTQFAQRYPVKNPERVGIMYNYLKRYADNPDLI